ARGLACTVLVSKPLMFWVRFAWGRVAYKAAQIVKKRLEITALVAAIAPLGDEVLWCHLVLALFASPELEVCLSCACTCDTFKRSMILSTTSDKHFWRENLAGASDCIHSSTDSFCFLRRSLIAFRPAIARLP